VRFAKVRKWLEFQVETFGELLRSSFCSNLVGLTNARRFGGGVWQFELAALQGEACNEKSAISSPSRLMWTVAPGSVGF
jgi:hypothetical protein